MEKEIGKNRTCQRHLKIGNIGVVLLTVMIITACTVYEQTVRTAIDDAVSIAVEREMSALMAGYTDVMMYQLVYTQSFYLGGFGVVPEDYEVGQGATWRVTTVDRDEESSYTAERALISRLDDGSTWWYLNFDPDDAESVEYEILLSPQLQAREMYFRDPETGDIRYHEFAHDETEAEELEEGEESLEAYGYQTGHYYADSWSEYHERTEEITIGAGTYHAEVLLFNPRYVDEDVEHNVEYRWWLNEMVPGHLVQFEYRDLENGGAFHGEMVDLRDDYSPRFVNL